MDFDPLLDGDHSLLDVQALELVAVLDGHTPGPKPPDDQRRIALRNLRQSLAKVFPERFAGGPDRPVYVPNEEVVL